MSDSTASAPDGEQEVLFTPLVESHPELAEELAWRYANRFLAEAGLDSKHLQEAHDTVELRLGPSDPEGGRELRIRSFITGTTYWFGPWDGSASKAEQFVDEAAKLQGSNIQDERRHGRPLPWDA